jgi:glycosyltransferase involved in cell wall biosynthesis
MGKAVVVVSEGLAQFVPGKNAKSRVYVIPNGANTDLFCPGAHQVYAVPGPYALFFGALAPWQGIEVLLAATRHLDWPHEVTLVVAGDGERRAEVEAAVAAGDRVRYLGRVAYRDMPGLVAGSLAGLSVQNSRERAATGLSPLKVYETLACGVPVVISDFQGPAADLVREGACGIQVPTDDPGAVARAVTLLFHNGALREALGRRGRSLVERKHSWKIRAEATDAAIRATLADQLESGDGLKMSFSDFGSDPNPGSRKGPAR